MRSRTMLSYEQWLDRVEREVRRMGKAIRPLGPDYRGMYNRRITPRRAAEDAVDRERKMTAARFYGRTYSLGQ